jgi:peptidoglycan/LPS O-acetylase OafA/YrhL
VHTSLGYQPAPDALRAVAMLGVLLYHAEVSWAPRGFLGVDAFFVLSGFLITSILVGEWRKRGRVGGVPARGDATRQLSGDGLLPSR